MLKKRYLILFLTAAVAGALLFGWGYHHGATSVEIRDSVIVRYRPAGSSATQFGSPIR